MPFQLPPILQSAPVALASLDLEGRVRDANRALLEMSGCSAEDLTGVPLSGFLTTGAGAVIARFGDLAAGRSDSYRTACQYRRRDGELRDADVTVSLVRQADGTPQMCLAAIEDVTARQRAARETLEARAALQVSEARYRSLVEQAPLSIQILSPEGRTLQVNAAWERLWGLTLDSLGDYNILEDPQLEERGLAAFIRTAFEGRPARIPAALYDADRTLPDRSVNDDPRRWVRAVIYPLTDADGSVREVVLIHQDITDQVHAEEERHAATRLRLEEAEHAQQKIEAASRLKDDFLANLSHELRTPLNAILGWARILSDREKDPATAHALEVIQRNAVAQARLVDDLLDLSRITSGKIRLHSTLVDLAAVATAAVETVRPAAEAKGVRLTSAIDPELPPVAGDAERLHQVFWNVLSNAVRFSSRDDRVWLTLARDGDFAVATIADSGAGIAPAFLPFVFDRFAQGDSSSTRVHPGLGLGLAIVRHLVELHGGSVSAESAGKGQGATFRIRLPLPGPE